MADSDRIQRLVAALTAMCKLRGIPLSGYALSKHLNATDSPVHPNTLDEVLKGEHWPRLTTVESIVTGLNASDAERNVILALYYPELERSVVSWREAIKPYLDMGRETEEVLWEYHIGLSDDDDVCIEHRRTTIRGETLRFVSFEPGQIGLPIVDLVDLVMNLRIQGLHELQGSRKPITLMPQPIQVEPSENRLGVAICLGEPVSEGILHWTVKYPWSGLWQLLRQKGMDQGRLNFPGPRPKVTRAAVAIKAPLPQFDDLEFRPQFPQRGAVEQRRDRMSVHIKWTVDSPGSSIGFEVRSGERPKEKGRVPH